MYENQLNSQDPVYEDKYEYKSIILDATMRESCIDAQKLFGWEFYETKHHSKSEKVFLGYHTEYRSNRAYNLGGTNKIGDAYTAPVYKTNTYHSCEFVFRREKNLPNRDTLNQLEHKIPLDSYSHYSERTNSLCYIRKPEKSFVLDVFNLISIVAAIFLAISVVMVFVGITDIKPTDYLIIAAMVVVFIITISLNIRYSKKKKKYRKDCEKLISAIKQRIAEELKILSATR